MRTRKNQEKISTKIFKKIQNCVSDLPEDDDAESGVRGGSIDDRVYVCRTWRMEPKLRFLYWNSALEAPGVDSILQQLGFRHAKVTIPKWFQRGILDKLDSTHSVLAKKLLQIYYKNKDL